MLQAQKASDWGGVLRDVVKTIDLSLVNNLSFWDGWVLISSAIMDSMVQQLIANIDQV